MTTYWRTKPEYLFEGSGHSDHYVKVVDGIAKSFCLADYIGSENLWVPLGLTYNYVIENFQNKRYYQVSESELMLELL